LVPDPLPRPLDQPRSCDHGGDLIIVLNDGREITYGPCDYPWQISQLWGAMIQVSEMTTPGVPNIAAAAAQEQVRQALRIALTQDQAKTKSHYTPTEITCAPAKAGRDEQPPGYFCAATLHSETGPSRVKHLTLCAVLVAGRFAYVLHQRPNVHGGYFEGLLSQQLIYRLACLGYDGTVAAYGSEAALGSACEQKQIRMLVSPALWDLRKTGPVAPPRPAEEKPRTAAPTAQPQSAPAPAAIGAVVPNLVGMPIIDARAAIATLRNALVESVAPPVRGSEPQILLLEITRDVPGQTQGTVLSQTPAPGTRVEQRMSIEVVIAK